MQVLSLFIYGKYFLFESFDLKKNYLLEKIISHKDTKTPGN